MIMKLETGYNQRNHNNKLNNYNYRQGWNL